MSGPPDMLLILSDQHARRVTGAYGNDVVATPALDRLAASGVTFDNAYCASPICVPSRMSMLTGQWPCDQGCWTLTDMLGSDRPTYAHALGAAGYRTVLVGRLHAIGPDQHHGFCERTSGEAGTNWPGGPRQALGVLDGAQAPGRASLENAGAGQSVYEVVDESVTREAEAMLARLAAERRAGDSRPLLVVVGLLLPHCPFVARRADYDLYRDRVPPPETPHADADHPLLQAWRKAAGIDAPGAAAIARARAAYYGLVTALDRMIGRLLDAFAAHGFAGSGLVAYTSDHGEMLGEHGLWWKNCFYEDAVTVPLILSWPARLPPRTRCRHVVNLADVGATLIDAGGAPALPRSRGRSLLPIASQPRAHWVQETFSEYVTDAFSAFTGPRPVQSRMFRSGSHKLAFYHGHRPQLFDLDDDPEERNDRADDPACAEIREALTARVLEGWHPEAIAAELDARGREKQVLAAWTRAVRPASPYQVETRGEDNWLEDDV